MAQPIDFLGVNYYMPALIRARVGTPANGAYPGKRRHPVHRADRARDGDGLAGGPDGPVGPAGAHQRRLPGRTDDDHRERRGVL
jgi:hypothetical protein